MVVQSKIPIIWERSELGYRIETLRKEHFPTVLSMIKNDYLPNEFLFKSYKKEFNQTCEQSVLDRATRTLNDNASLVLIDENNKDSIVGFILLSIVNQIDFGRIFSRTSLVDSQTHKNYIAIHTALHKKVDIYYDYDCETFIRFYMMYVHDLNRHFYLSTQLFKAAFDLARCLKIKTMCGVFNTWKIQQVVLKLGFKIIHEISYDEWLDDENQVIYRDRDGSSDICALMVIEIPPAVVPVCLIEEPVVVPVESSKKGNKSKKGKKKGAKKK